MTVLAKVAYEDLMTGPGVVYFRDFRIPTGDGEIVHVSEVGDFFQLEKKIRKEKKPKKNQHIRKQ